LGLKTYGSLLWTFKYPLLIALAGGTAAGTGVFFAGPWFASATSAVGGFVTMLGVQAGLWLRRLTTLYGEESA